MSEKLTKNPEKHAKNLPVLPSEGTSRRSNKAGFLNYTVSKGNVRGTISPY